MKLPKKINTKSGIFNLIQEYEKFGVYESEKFHYRKCFSKYDLGLLKEEVESTKYLNTEKFKT